MTKSRCITVPLSQDAMLRLDYNQAGKNELYEIALNEEEFLCLWENGVFDDINKACKSLIDDFESETIIGLETMNKMREVLNRHYVSGQCSHELIKLMELTDRAIQFGTGIFFYF